MAKSTREIEQGIITNAPDAARVEEVLRLFPDILLRYDLRVQAVFGDWCRRMANEAPLAESYTLPAVMSGLMVDLRAIVTLIAELGLTRYKSWLAKGLLLAFLRAHSVAVASVLPPIPTEAWATRGKRPKRTGPKGYRLENLERVMLTYYRCEVQAPPVPKRRLAILQNRARADVQHDCVRAVELLACINATPPPDFPVS